MANVITGCQTHFTLVIKLDSLQTVSRWSFINFLKGTLCVLVAWYLLIQTVFLHIQHIPSGEKMLGSNMLTNATMQSKFFLFWVWCWWTACPHNLIYKGNGGTSYSWKKSDGKMVDGGVMVLPKYLNLLNRVYVIVFVHNMEWGHDWLNVSWHTVILGLGLENCTAL